MPICCAMGARRPTPSGGSRMRPGDNNSSRRPPGSLVLAGESSVTRPPSRSTSNSRAFASVTIARLCSLRSSGAGLMLLLRILCPDGKKRRGYASNLDHIFKQEEVSLKDYESFADVEANLATQPQKHPPTTSANQEVSSV